MFYGAAVYLKQFEDQGWGEEKIGLDPRKKAVAVSEGAQSLLQWKLGEFSISHVRPSYDTQQDSALEIDEWHHIDHISVYHNLWK